MYHGIRNEIPGIRRASRMNTASFLCVNRAIEYAAGSPRTSDKPTATVPTIVEFRKYFRKSCSPKTFS